MSMKLLLISALVAVSLADLRRTSYPKDQFKNLADKKCFGDYALYMEPSDFGYAKLKQQRDENDYDQFLRSNIDNQQDNRDWRSQDPKDQEAGKDMLPFRSFESAAYDSHDSVENKIADSPVKPAAIVVKTGTPYLMPFRWNNPHASELEVNIWIMRNGNPVVVPVRKPACSGEGYQDVMLDFTIPVDFSQLGTKITGFQGCKIEGDCVLQIYAHSVETRTYAIGVPLLVETSPGKYDVDDVTTNSDILRSAGKDLNVRFSSLRPLCLGSNSKETDFESCVPRYPRLVSDVWNHAYQNSDYSPYSGQQPESISQNLQAACVIQMIAADRGELGHEHWKRANRPAYSEGKKLRKRVKEKIKAYEDVARDIMNLVMIPSEDTWTIDDTMKCQGTEIENTAKCFRCAEVGSRSTSRQDKTTYVPSFEVPEKFVQKAKDIIDKAVALKLMSESPNLETHPSQLLFPSTQNLMTVRGDKVGVVQIYIAVGQDMNADFYSVSQIPVLKDSLSVAYQGPMIKTEKMATKADANNYKMVSAADPNKRDDGHHTASLVAEEHRLHMIPVTNNMFSQVLQIPRRVAASSVEENVPARLFGDDEMANSALGMTISWLSAFSLFVGVVFQF